MQFTAIAHKLIVLLVCDLSYAVIYHRTQDVSNPSVTQCVHKAYCKPMSIMSAATFLFISIK